ncbi:MAG TPA: leishmanolysin-related zinc metalloendopeptidase [Longimicrobiales bacterium]|nr:leishmanolysin-related zinc metalloendopeptidase [Longimicrobiales bacterium]
MSLRIYGRLAVAAALMVAACSDGPTEPATPQASAVEKRAGDGQTAQAGSGVPVAPAVLVLDSRGRPVSGTAVRFVVTLGGGAVQVEQAVTGESGIASAGLWTLGEAGANEVEARVGALPAVRFSATALAPQAPPSPEPPVTPPPAPAGAYSITVRYLGTPTARHRAAVAAAVARWESVVYGDLPSIPLNSAAASCFPNQPAVNETVDDLLLFVELVPIDGPGKILGSAGPCYVRSGGGLPVAGYMKLDTDDLERMEVAGTLDDVVLHEVGHVLGIGTMWPQKSLLSGAGGEDPGFTGSYGLGAYRGLGGGLAVVPVENTGGVGTRDSHWRESVFGNELMTGYIGSGGNPLSALTIASLQDLGYGATQAVAATFTIAGAHAGFTERVHMEGHEEVILPTFRIDRDGRKERIRQETR